jgi:hypothetical protein
MGSLVTAPYNAHPQRIHRMDVPSIIIHFQITTGILMNRRTKVPTVIHVHVKMTGTSTGGPQVAGCLAGADVVTVGANRHWRRTTGVICIDSTIRIGSNPDPK